MSDAKVKSKKAQGSSEANSLHEPKVLSFITVAKAADGKPVFYKLNYDVANGLAKDLESSAQDRPSDVIELFKISAANLFRGL